MRGCSERLTGSLGASKIRDAISRLKKGERAKIAEDLMYEIAAERLTGIPARQVNARQWGVDQEAEARTNYAFCTNAPVVETIGLVPPSDDPQATPIASPDAVDWR